MLPNRFETRLSKYANPILLFIFFTELESFFAVKLTKRLRNAHIRVIWLLTDQNEAKNKKQNRGEQHWSQHFLKKPSLFRIWTVAFFVVWPFPCREVRKIVK